MKTNSKRTLAPLTIAMAGALLLGACDSKSRAEASTDHATPAHEDELAAAMRQIDPAGIIRAVKESPERYPVQYGVVVSVTPGTPAARIGITPGALILERAGSSLDRFKLVGGTGDLVWLDLLGKLRRDQVEGGSVGYRMEIQRNFTSWYILNGNRNPSWDPDVVAALAVHERDPELASRFWERAGQSGYPADALSNLCRMNIACLLGEAGKAASFAKAFGSLENSPAGLPQYETDWQQVTAVTGDPSWIAAATEFFNDRFLNDKWRDDYTDISDMLTLTFEDSATPPSAAPSELAKHMQRTSILPDLETKARWTSNDSSVAKRHMQMYSAAAEAQGLGKTEFAPQRLSQSRDFMHKSWAGPKEKARDVDMTLEFTVSPLNGSSPSQYMREFHIGLANRTMHGGRNEAQVPPSARILSLCFGFGTSSEPGLSWISASVPSRMAWSKLTLQTNPFQLSRQGLFANIPDHRPKPGAKHILRVVRVGNQAEALLEGKRIALVNVPPHIDDTGVCWFISGVEVTITSFRADVLN
jgi:hypothetical protein